jgi:predicted AlkP superfamily pyrophosphatase or phosphodiesterase
VSASAGQGWRRAALVALVAALGALSAPQPAAARPVERPLVYVVVLDGLDGDRIEAGAAPFISSLLSGEGASAAYFPGSRSVVPTETNPNHVAMMSGAYPGASGIPSNTFAIYAPLADEDGCARAGPFDLRTLPTETSGESRTCPKAEMTFAAIKRQGNPDELATAAVFGKPKLGRLFSQATIAPRRTDVDYLWAPCSSGAEDDSYCADVPTNPISTYALDDRTVMDAVLRTIDGPIAFPYGRTRPNLTFVNLHQIDSAGHITGTGLVYDLAIAQADDEVERLVTTLRARGEWDRTVLILVSDHSMDSMSRKLSLTDAFTSAGIGASQFVALNNESSIDFIYLADRRSRARFELLKRMREVALAQPGVTEALYREPNPADGGREHTIDAAHPGWHASGERTGDLFVLARPGTGFGEPSPLSNILPGNHGAIQTQDNFLAVVGGSDLVRQGTVQGGSRAARPLNVDVAPTVMGLFGLFAPHDSRGRFLGRAFDRAALRESSRPHRPRLVRRHGRAEIRPAGGRYDVEVRRPGGWRRVASKTARSRLPAALDSRLGLRVRARSAAGVPSRWRTRRGVSGP